MLQSKRRGNFQFSSSIIMKKWLENQLHLIKSPKEGTFSKRILKFKWGVSCHVNLNGTLWRKVSSASFSFILHHSEESTTESSSSPTYKIFEISLVVIWWNDFNFDWWLWYSQEDSSSTLNVSSRVKPQKKIPRDLLTDRKASGCFVFWPIGAKPNIDS